VSVEHPTDRDHQNDWSEPAGRTPLFCRDCRRSFIGARRRIYCALCSRKERLPEFTWPKLLREVAPCR
jgi:hypothetical protein